MGKGTIILAQVDHADGEALGHSIERLYDLGARNVQVLSAVTKKNRPGYVLLVDLPAERVEDTAMYLGTELGIWGFHLLGTEHVHFDIAFREVPLKLISGQQEISYPLRVKYIRNDGRLIKIKLDYDQMAEIQRVLAEQDCHYALDALRAALTARLREEENLPALTLYAEQNGHAWGSLRAT